MLLSCLEEVVEKHSHAKVLEHCVKTLEILCKEDTIFYDRFNAVRNSIIDLFVKQFFKALDYYASLEAKVSRQLLFKKNSIYFESHLKFRMKSQMSPKKRI